MSASDMELSIEKTIDVSDAEEGTVVLPARLFTEIIRKLPNEYINIESGEFSNVTVSTSSSEFKIVGMTADEFPEIGTVNENRKISVNRDIFREMIKKTSFAASIDESKGVIVGVLIEMRDGTINMAALDGFRMSVATEKTDNEQNTDIIIAARILNEISKIIAETDEENEDIELILDNKKAVIMTEDSRIILRIIEGSFLKYRDLIPAEFATTVNIDRSMLTDSIERASLFAKEGRNNLIKISVTDDNLEITSKSEAGNVNENIPVKKNGADIEIGFNSKYLLEGLKAIKDNDIVMKFNTSVTPCIIEPVEEKNFTYLLLPVRIMA
jgi:DNA polymerase-3 subunit beta